MRQVLRQAALSVCFVACASGVARAGDDTAVREAQARFEEGLGRLKSDNYEAARLSFRQAYAVLKRPSILWNLALAEEKSGHFLEALDHFRDYVRQFPSDDDRVGAQRHFDALMAQTGHIEVQAPPGTQLLLDGAASGTAPLSWALDVVPGKHRIEGRAPEGTRGSDVEVAPGQVVRVALGGAAEGAPGDALPGRPAAPATEPQAPEPSAPHADTAPEARRRLPTAQLVTVAAGGGLALISIGLGVYFGLQSQSEADVVAGFKERYSRSQCAGSPNVDPCPKWNDALQSQNRDATWSNVLYVTGGVLAAATVATWLLWPRESTTPAVTVAPSVGLGQLGLSAAGRF